MSLARAVRRPWRALTARVILAGVNASSERRRPAWRRALLFLFAGALLIFSAPLATVLVAGDRASEELRAAVEGLRAAGAPVTAAAWYEATGLSPARPGSPTDPEWKRSLSSLVQRIPDGVPVLHAGVVLEPFDRRQSLAWLEEADPAIDELLTVTARGHVSENLRVASRATAGRLEYALREDPEAVPEALARHAAVLDRGRRSFEPSGYGQWLDELLKVHARLRLAGGAEQARTWLAPLDVDREAEDLRRTLLKMRVDRLASLKIVDSNGEVDRVKLGRMWKDDPDHWSPFAELRMVRFLGHVDRMLRRLDDPTVEPPSLEQPWYDYGGRRLRELDAKRQRLLELRAELGLR